ncbi:MAG: hypothetical protein ACE5D4_06215, partial [Thermodesulfobacteriota bacterium]
IHFAGSNPMEVIGSIGNRKGAAFIARTDTVLDGNDSRDRLESICAGDIVELGVDFEKLLVAQGDEVRFYITIMTDQGEESRCPTRGHCLITVPSEDYERYNWYV